MRKQSEPIDESISSPWLNGQLIIWGILLASSLIVTCLLRFTPLSEKTLPSIAYIVNVISLFLGGYFSGKAAGTRGWLFGGLQGLIYATVLILIAFLAFDTVTQLHPTLLCIWGFVLSALGGILGVNQLN
ncbi:putative membrane protein, TIGR04086 family [Seinonella peptonophila]|uniref:Putative membrane protein, TIGR04086 family n=1 Tax=Seinonella peptonophila TaxID=112248 RepID=A0A1M4TR35_9BACL|nr:TIGR04086 family membrane protein [Seinonella peptonophila]SHE46979.1 putative membrane protein, TIGR04086 family [Seinonella peptonophila]